MLSCECERRGCQKISGRVSDFILLNLSSPASFIELHSDTGTCRQALGRVVKARAVGHADGVLS